MPVNEPGRRFLHNRLVTVVGEREPDLMMETFTNPEAGAQAAELRVELHTGIAGLRTKCATAPGDSKLNSPTNAPNSNPTSSHWLSTPSADFVTTRSE